MKCLKWAICLKEFVLGLFFSDLFYWSTVDLQHPMPVLVREMYY